MARNVVRDCETSNDYVYWLDYGNDGNVIVWCRGPNSCQAIKLCEFTHHRSLRVHDGIPSSLDFMTTEDGTLEVYNKRGNQIPVPACDEVVTVRKMGVGE